MIFLYILISVAPAAIQARAQRSCAASYMYGVRKLAEGISTSCEISRYKLEAEKNHGKDSNKI